MPDREYRSGPAAGRSLARGEAGRARGRPRRLGVPGHRSDGPARLAPRRRRHVRGPHDGTPGTADRGGRGRGRGGAGRRGARPPARRRRGPPPRAPCVRARLPQRRDACRACADVRPGGNASACARPAGVVAADHGVDDRPRRRGGPRGVGGAAPGRRVRRAGLAGVPARAQRRRARHAPGTAAVGPAEAGGPRRRQPSRRPAGDPAARSRGSPAPRSDPRGHAGARGRAAPDARARTARSGPCGGARRTRTAEVDPTGAGDTFLAALVRDRGPPAHRRSSAVGRGHPGRRRRRLARRGRTRSHRACRTAPRCWRGSSATGSGERSGPRTRRSSGSYPRHH